VSRVDRRATAWRTFWVTMVGFGISIVVGIAARLRDRQLAHAYAAVYR
jgi:NitT/TauT family transport system permease protein